MTSHSQPNPSRLLAVNEILSLQREGTDAALRGDGPETCPYRHADTPLDRARRNMWIRGYSAGRTQRRQQAE